MGSGRLWGRLCAHAHRQARVRGYVLCEGVLRVCACQMRTQYSQPTYVRLGLRLPRLPSQAAAANAHCSRVTGPLWPSALGINAYISLWHSSVSVCIHLWRGGTQCTLVWSGMGQSKRCVCLWCKHKSCLSCSPRACSLDQEMGCKLQSALAICYPSPLHPAGTSMRTQR